MGTNTITTQSGGKILAAHLNEYFDALTEDWVPRNSSGVATDQGGDWGSSLYRYLRGFFYSVKLGTVAQDVGFGYSGTKLAMKKSGTNYLRIGNRSLHQVVPTGKPPTQSFTALITDDSAYVEIARIDDVECSGRPVLIYIAEKSVGINIDGDSPELIQARIQLVRGVTVIKTWELELECEQDGSISPNISTGKLFSVPANCVMAWDLPAAGTHDYILQGKVMDAGATLFTGVTMFDDDEVIQKHLTIKEF